MRPNGVGGRAQRGAFSPGAGGWLALCLSACHGSNTAPQRATGAADLPARAPAVDTPAKVEAAVAAEGEPCGALECRKFASASSALSFVLGHEPLALGIGEAHTPVGREHLASTARRFSEQLLPVLAGRASHLIVELLSPDPRCEVATREVREAHEPVTQAQSKHNQDDYVELGRLARSHGIEPFVLSPTCAEYAAIASAGADAVSRTLSTIADVTARMARRALVTNHNAGREQLIVLYGGALHNDVNPDSARAAWSYGPNLMAFTKGRYVELDLIVRELIKDNEAWRALPWHASFDPELHPQSHVLMRTAPDAYVLFFPKSSEPVADVP